MYLYSCRLDYSGIAFLIVGSFIPCLYYGFYCRRTTQIIYMVTVSTLGILCIIISLWDKFGTPKYRPLRAGKFHFAADVSFVSCKIFLDGIVLLVAMQGSSISRTQPF